MDFLDKIVLPQSANHMELLRGLLTITFIILIPYLSILTGSTIYSILYLKKKKTGKESLYFKFAKELIDMVTLNKSMAFGFGIIPLITAVFCYAQLLDKTGSYVAYHLTVSLIFLIAALLFLYTYKYAFHLKDIFRFISSDKIKESNDESIEDEFEKYSSTADRIFNKFAGWGLLFLLIADYKLINAIQLALNPQKWAPNPSFLSVWFSVPVIVNFITFLIASLAVTAIVVLYIYFRPNSNFKGNDEYLNIVKNFSLKSGLLFTLFIPIDILLNIVVVPSAALNANIFLFSLIALILILIACNFLYVMIKEGNLKYVPSTLFVFILIFAFLIVKDQFAFETASSKHFAVLENNYEQHSKNLKEKLGVISEKVSGKDIFNGRCIACHSFDHKVVGPPYNETLPQFEGKMDELVDFILNPRKINKDYPIMPNQGLKPNEARAVAEYIMSVYKENKK